MHEYIIACEIFEQVLATAKAHNASEVRSITLEIGIFTHVNPDQLSFCFGVLAEGSIAKGAKLRVKMRNPFLECECGYRGQVSEPWAEKKEELLSELLEYATAFKCPVCKKQARIVGGRELIIKSIDIEK